MLIVSGRCQNYQNWAVSDQLTDGGRGEESVGGTDQISIKTPNPYGSTFLKNLPVRYLAADVHLFEAPDPLPPSYTVHCMNTYPSTSSHREGGRGVGEPVRRGRSASLQEGSKILT
jgi:hypothetical protein